MTQKSINLGTADQGNGDPLRVAFGKVNDNFTELYTALGLVDNTLNLGAFEFAGSVISTTDSSAIVIDQAVTVSSNLTVGGDVLPSVANGGDLGSAARPWRSLYVSNSTIYIGDTSIGVDSQGNLLVGGQLVTDGGGGTTNKLVNGVHQLELIVNGTTPYVTFPSHLNEYVYIQGGEINVVGHAGLLSTNNEVFLMANADGLQKIWTFGTDGVLTLPTGGDIVDSSGTTVLGGGTADTGSWTFDTVTATTDGNIIVKAGSGEAAWASLLSNNGANSFWVDDVGAHVTSNFVEGEVTENYWTFGADGNLTLPTQGKIMPVGDVNSFLTFNYGDDVELKAGDNLYLSGSVATIRTNGNANQWIFGTDGQLTAPGTITAPNLIVDDGNISLTTNGSGIQGAMSFNLYTNNFTNNWNFSQDGNLTLPKASKISEVTPATGAAANVIVIQNASSILNTRFASLPPAAISNYAVPGTDIVVNVTWTTNGEDYHAPAFVVVDGGTGHTGGGQFGGGDVLTVPYADMGISGGGNWTWYVVDIASNLVLEAGTKDWTFDNNGDLNIPPGGTIRDAMTGDDLLRYYDPDDTDNWNEPTINTISAALDELAARVTALQNYEIDGGNAYTPALGELLIDGNGA